MKLKNLIQRIFCKDLLDRVAKLEETVTNITAERDALSDQLAAAELANNILRTEYDNYRNNPGNARPANVPHCKSCKSCKREEIAVGKVIFSCDRMGGKQIFVGEGRTSPKWCPLRPFAALGDLTSSINSAIEAARKLGEEVSRV